MQKHPKKYPTDLSDEEWDHIKALVPQPKSGRGKRGRPAVYRRQIVNAVFYIVRSGCAWRLLPNDFPHWRTVYGYFRTWSQDWTWNFIHDTLRDWVRKTEGRTVAPTAAIIDSQSVKTAEQAGERGYDAGKKVKGRKRHIAVDSLGLLLGVLITTGAIQDRSAAKTLIECLVQWYRRLQIIWAERLPGRISPMGQSASPLWQAEAGDCPAQRARIQSPAQALDCRENLRLVL